MTHATTTAGTKAADTGNTSPVHRLKRARLISLFLLLTFSGGCSLDGLLKSDQLPPDVTDPAVTETPNGALLAYRGALVQLRVAFAGNAVSDANFVRATGRFSDELGAGGDAFGQLRDYVNRRSVFEAMDTVGSTVSPAYSALQVLRGQTNQAIGLLDRYLPEQPALLGHMYAVQAYAEVFLAELFCSGIPLSTVDYNGDYTLRPGSTTNDVFSHALASFETALTLSADSARILDLVRVGQGRARLALGQYGAAAAAVASVPDDFKYAIGYSNTTTVSAIDPRNFTFSSSGAWGSSVADLEGINGLDYRSSGDPRTAVIQQASGSQTVFRPLKYHTATGTPTGANPSFNGSSPVVLASGIEARLIEAEALLQAGDTVGWLDKLNHLRRTMWPSIKPAVTEPLVDLADPGTAAGRVDLTFRERAFWLFLTGQRLGDLRRLVRNYGRTADQVYPTGPYTAGLFYGPDVVAPIPQSERTLNPLFTGCLSTDA